MIRFREYENTKLRNVKAGVLTARDDTPGSTKPTVSSDLFADQSEGLRMVSMDENHGHPPYKSGGLLFLYRMQFATYLQSLGRPLVSRRLPDGGYGTFVQSPSTNYKFTYQGGLVPTLTSIPGYAQTLGSENIRKDTDYDANVNPNDLDTLGARAYNRLRPKVERASLLQDVIEAREIPSMLKQTSRGFHDVWKGLGGSLAGGWKAAPSKVAEQFLNGAFGWRPFVRSITTTCDTVLFASDYIAETIRNNNRWLNRRFAEDQIQSEDFVYGSYGTSTPLVSPVLDTNFIQPFSCLFEVRRQKMTRIWYEGSFKFYRPEFDADLKSGYPALRKLRQMVTLLGLNLNATTVYRVTPWTWLVDWFVNVGDNVQALEDLGTDQVAARYVYLMRETFDRFEFRVQFKSRADNSTYDLKWYKSASVKRRRQSESPFGFTLLPSALTPMQYAILASLGLTWKK